MKILIVDDEQINRTLLLCMLREAGFTDCIEAESGEAALDIIIQQPPDLVLLDVIMPGLTGFEVAPKIREHVKNRYLPILFITALDDKESLVRCLEVGGNDFATKPFDKHILTAKIKAHEKIWALSARIEEQNKALRFYQQRVAREHAIVEHIFSHAIVNEDEILTYFDHHLAPAETFNGDVFICKPSPSGGLYFLVGDFTGHGLASAIGALPVTRAFQEMTAKGLAVSELALELNNVLLRFLPADMFMAAVIGEIGADGKRLTLWQGGMPEMLLVSENGDVRRLNAKHMALGILESQEFNSDSDTLTMRHGDQLVCYTDGLMEVTHDKKEMLGEEGIRQWCLNSAVVTANGLYQHAKSYNNHHVFDDDVTVVVFKSQPLALHKCAPVELDIPASIDIALTHQHLKLEGVLQRVLQVASQCSGIQLVRSTLFTVISEMFSNALEHGILKMDSSIKHSTEGFAHYYAERELRLAALEHGFININITALPTDNLIKVSVKDSGEGFEYQASPQPSEEATFGRGLALIKSLCHDILFEEGGSKIICLLKTNVTN